MSRIEPPESVSRSAVRNVGILAHVDAGKTTCTERLLYFTGRIHRTGEVHDGNTTTDFDPLEQKKGITISAAATSTTWTPTGGPFAGTPHRIRILDTPGHVDFTIEVERSLRVLDGAVALLDAGNGVEPQSETVLRQADAHGVPRLVFVNKMDKAAASFSASLASLRERLSGVFVPLQLPIGEGASFTGVVDLVTLTAHRFDEATRVVGGAMTAIPLRDLPVELSSSVKSARQDLLSAIADEDDAVLAAFCEGRGDELPAGLVSAAIRKATLSRRLTPVLCGSAFKNKGIQMLLDAIIDYLPSPADRPPVEGARPGDGAREARPPTALAPLSAIAFKVVADPGAGAVTWLRLYSGSLRSGSVVLSARTGRRERIGRLFQLHGKEREELSVALAGDIVAVLGLRDVRSGDTLADPAAPIALEALTVPDPVIAVALVPKGAADRERLGPALSRLALEDPSLRLATDGETGGVVALGMGELHLDVVVEKLRRAGVEVRALEPSVAYRETVRGVARVDHKHAHQNGGVGQFARVVLEVGPLPRGAGFVFEDATVGGAIPRELVPAVEKGIRQAMARGILAGYPVVDVRARLLDGAAHVKDSSPLAFEIAASVAFQEAARAAGPTLLEPIMRLEVTTEEGSFGAVLGDLASRRAEVRSTGARGRDLVAIADVPLRSLFGYVTALRGLSQGRGAASMQLERYGEVPPPVVAAVIGRA